MLQHGLQCRDKRVVEEEVLVELVGAVLVDKDVGGDAVDLEFLVGDAVPLLLAQAVMHAFYLLDPFLVLDVRGSRVGDVEPDYLVAAQFSGLVRLNGVHCHGARATPRVPEIHEDDLPFVWSDDLVKQLISRAFWRILESGFVDVGFSGFRQFGVHAFQDGGGKRMAV